MTITFKEVLLEVAQLFGHIDTIFDAVAKLKDHSNDIVVDLIDALDDADASAQAATAFSLCHLFYVFWPEEIDASPSITTLLTLIGHADLRLRFEAARAVAVLQVGRTLRLTNEKIVAIYIGCLECDDPILKTEVAGQLKAMGPPAIAALPALSRMLDDENPKIQMAVHESIEEIRLSQCPLF